GLLEIPKPSLDAIRRKLIPIEAALQVKLVSLWVDTPSARQACLLEGRDFDLDLPDNGPCHLTLQGHHITQIALIVLGPEVPVRRGVDQLRRNPDPVC